MGHDQITVIANGILLPNSGALISLLRDSDFDTVCDFHTDEQSRNDEILVTIKENQLVIACRGSRLISVDDYSKLTLTPEKEEILMNVAIFCSALGKSLKNTVIGEIMDSIISDEVSNAFSEDLHGFDHKDVKIKSYIYSYEGY